MFTIQKGLNIKIPVNVFKYKSYIYGIPIDKFIMIIFGISIFSILFNINLVTAIIFLIVFLIFNKFIKFDISNINEFTRKIGFKDKNKIINIQKYDDFCYYDTTYLRVYKVSTRNIYLNVGKKYYIDLINNFIDLIECDLNIITREKTSNTDYIGNSKIYYELYFILHGDKERLSKSSTILKNYFNENCYEINDISKIKELLIMDFNEKHNSYAKNKDDYILFMDLEDANYDQDFLYNLLIESLNFPVLINMEVRRVNNSNIKLKRMLAERLSEKRNKNNKNKNLDDQINSIKNIMKNENVLNMYMRITIKGKHPVDLKNNFNETLNLLKSIGMKFKLFKYYKGESNDILKLNKTGIKYLIGSKEASSMIPYSFTEYPENTKNYIGYEIINRKAFYFNPFKKESFNVIITGETGSGKTYFSKKLIKRFGNEPIFIIDPLNEYFTGTIVDYSKGDYIDINIEENSQKTILSNAIKSILKDISEMEILKNIENTSRINKNIKYILNELLKIYKNNDNYNSLEYYINNHFKNPVKLSDKITFKYDFSKEKFIVTNFGFILSTIYNIITSNDNKKIIFIDEAHTLLKNPEISEMLDMAIRNSRHYNTSLVNITQNIDDFYFNEFSKSILKNSMHFFIFRQKDPVNIFMDIGIKPSNLKGGNGTDYSECFYYSSGYITRLKILP